MTEETAVPAFDAFRLADSFLPEGSDTLSYGLEQFVEQGDLENAGDCRALLETYVRDVIGPADLIALRHAHAGAVAGDLDAVAAADRRLECVTLAREFRVSSTRSGGRLLDLHTDVIEDDRLEQYAQLVDEDHAPGHYAVILGVVSAVNGIEETVACRIVCHGFVTGLLGAAQRLASIGHTDVQQVLLNIQPAIEDAVTASAGGSLQEMAPFAPLVDVATANHERADRRLFLS